MKPDLENDRPPQPRLTSLIDCAWIAMRAGRPADARALLDRASSQFWAAHGGGQSALRHRPRPDLGTPAFGRN